MESRWAWKVFPKSGIEKYEKLEPEEFHDAAQLRVEIFSNEQGYAYNDFDGRDKQALHLFCYKPKATKADEAKTSEAVLVAYARLMIPQYNGGELEVGRVLVHKDYRKCGLGSELMTRMIAKIDSEFPQYAAHLSITEDKFSAHLPHFYNKFGFKLKEGNALSNSPYYVYQNFSCIIKDMIRPAKAPVHTEDAKDGVSTTLTTSDKAPEPVKDQIVTPTTKVAVPEKADAQSVKAVEHKSTPAIGNVVVFHCKSRSHSARFWRQALVTSEPNTDLSHTPTSQTSPRFKG